MDFLETERLIVRGWEPYAHAEDAFLMWSDPEVVQYLNRPPDKDVAETRKNLQTVLKRYDSYRNGLGNFALVEKASNQVVGMVLLKNLPDVNMALTNEIEIGWHLRRTVWGRGYATEAAAALMIYGFEKLCLPTIWAVALEENKASLKVMERLGMRPAGRTTQYYGGEDLLVYRKDAP